MFVQAKERVPPTGAAPGRQPHEFLVVCNDSALIQTLATAVKKVNGRISCAPKASTAGDYAARREMDGIVIDMGLPGALNLIHRVRNGNSSRGSVVFAYMGAGDEQVAIRAGANFVLQQPLAPEKVAHIFNVAAGMMITEKRRCFRYPLMVPVELKMKERRLESTMSNLSEGGMAIWSLYYHAAGSAIEFGFELPFGALIRGQGEVAWINADGLAGIKFHILPDQAYTYLSEWIARRDTSSTS